MGLFATISLQQLKEAMVLGKLGEQIVLNDPFMIQFVEKCNVKDGL